MSEKVRFTQSTRFLNAESVRLLARAIDPAVCAGCSGAIPEGADCCPDCGMNCAQDEATRFEVSASSEFPVTRTDWSGAEYREVLDHTTAAVDMGRFASGTAAVLEEHRGAPVGVIESARIGEDRKLRAVIRFSRSQRGQEVAQDMADGIRRNVSIGYVPRLIRLEEKSADGVDTYRVMKWEPLELSIVGIPADPTVGLNRGNPDTSLPCIIEGGDTHGEIRTMEDRVEGQVVPQDAGKVERERVASIHETVASARAVVGSKLDDKVAEWVRSGVTVQQVQREVLAEMATRGTATEGSDPLKNVPDRDRSRYSYARAILGATMVAEGKRFDGLEAEVSEELLTSQPSTAQRRGGVLVPYSTRTQVSNVPGKGAEAIFEKPGDLIELLRNRTAVIQLGARVLTGLTAPIAFPKQSAAATAYWVGENSSSVPASDVTLQMALLTPKTLQATMAYSRQLLAQAGFDVEAMVRNELGLIHSLAIDYATIHGLAAAGEPTGIYNALNVGSQAIGGAMDYSKVLLMQGKVASANADLGSLGWLMNPTVASNLMGKAMFTNTATPVWTGPYADGRVAGYKAVATNQVSATMTGSARTGGSELGNIFGNWNDLIIGFWGALELVVDPYSQKKAGLVEVTSFQLADCLARHGESFAKSTGATG
jgi:HK97 family phage major capsid protein